jgi:DNA-binding CsgD family transcriptional regulator
MALVEMLGASFYHKRSKSPQEEVLNYLSNSHSLEEVGVQFDITRAKNKGYRKKSSSEIT